MTQGNTDRRQTRPLPAVTYPDSLPITQHRTEIIAACGENQVVIVAGETGSGKTTQLPKMLLELGCGASGMIGCTQPRRLAATSVSARVAEELGPSHYKSVGYQVRFDNRTTRDTVIKFMTDGILLTETQTDQQLRRYDALIIDEVHERSLNIDFLLGYLKRLLPKRPDLKLVISSATLDVQRFSKFFSDAPIIQVPGRTYPVELLYRAPDEDDFDVTAEVAATVAEITVLEPSSDILIFLAGERDIREAAWLIEGKRYENTDVLPLYSRLPAEQQRRAFVQGKRRRIILATNVAETSVTIPGIRIVIDPGQARVKRYNPRTQIEKLHIEPISQASANQRKGRCGRVGPGICIRLFDEGDFAKRAAYTDPEIKRSSLASVILTMLHLQLGEVAKFPFLDPPSPALIKDGYRELDELGAIDEHKRLTRLGRTLCRLSAEPRLGRMLIEGHRNGVLADVLTVVSALSVDDPRLRPPGREEDADRAHAQYATETSDFAALLVLWRHLKDAHMAHPSRRRFRTYCKGQFLSARRIAEWEAVQEQLQDECRQAKLLIKTTPTNDELFHRSILAGLLNKIGLRQERSGYRGARGMLFTIHPGSVLSSKRPEWIVVAELVETSRLFGRCVATVDPEWLQKDGRHLCRYRYGQPYWDEETGFVRAEETVLLYGLPLSHGQQRHYGPINPSVSRKVFIQHALVDRELRAPPPVIRRNIAAIQSVEELEARIRRRNILTPEHDLFAFYDQRLPPEVYSAKALQQWLQEDDRAEQELSLKAEDLMARDAPEITENSYPTHLDYGPCALPLNYQLRLGEEEDGITCTIPVSALQDLPAHPFEWLVPGFLPEKIHFLLKGLPKRYRREFVPIDRTVKRIIEDTTFHDAPLIVTLANWILKHYSLRIPDDAWPTELPPHLTMSFGIVDEAGNELCRGHSITELQSQVDGQFAGAPATSKADHPWEGSGITEWNFGALPKSLDIGARGWRVLQYPGLVDDGSSISLKLFDSPQESDRETAKGLVRLARLALPREVKQLRRLPEPPSLAQLTLTMLGSAVVPLKEQAIQRGICNACHFATDIPRDHDTFVERIYTGKSDFYSEAGRLLNLASRALEAAAGIQGQLNDLSGEEGIMAAADVLRQLNNLFAGAFLVDTPSVHLEQFNRYLKAIVVRVERFRTNPTRDGEKMQELSPHLERLKQQRPTSTELEAYRWMLEEWRVSLFAQELGTRAPVSAKRLDKQWARVENQV